MSTVYTYLVPSKNAIKIGSGADPNDRLKSYMKGHGLEGDIDSLLFWKYRTNEAALRAERHAQRQFENSGHPQVNHGSAKEIYSLNGLSYEDAVAQVSGYLNDLCLVGTGQGYEGYIASLAKAENKNADIKTPFSIKELLFNITVGFDWLDTLILDVKVEETNSFLEIVYRSRLYSMSELKARSKLFGLAHSEISRERNKDFGAVVYKNSDSWVKEMQNIGMKFHMVIGNPPHNDVKGNKKLWIDFIKEGVAALHEEGILAFVLPSDFKTNSSANATAHRILNDEGYALAIATGLYFDGVKKPMDILVWRKTNKRGETTIHYNDGFTDTRKISFGKDMVGNTKEGQLLLDTLRIRPGEREIKTTGYKPSQLSLQERALAEGPRILYDYDDYKTFDKFFAVSVDVVRSDPNEKFRNIEGKKRSLVNSALIYTHDDNQELKEFISSDVYSRYIREMGYVPVYGSGKVGIPGWATKTLSYEAIASGEWRQFK